MKIGVFDSGLGGLTVVKAISERFKGADIFYIADTAYAPYGDKTQEEIKNRCIQITEFLIYSFNIEAIIVACNTATSAAIKYLRDVYKDLIVIGTEPGIKPAINLTKSSKVAVLATKATLRGEKYQQLVENLSKDKDITLYEQACVGLVEQIEKGEINSSVTYNMLKNWLLPMKEKNVDTIVLGCTHYPLVSEVIRDIMGNKINLIETGEAIANRLIYLSSLRGHNEDKPLNISIGYTGKINRSMINKIFKDYNNKIEVRNCKI
ncbi:glutamate racemase [Malaciobacter molluscorum LMG 25693]|uniref:Glutamate racemase n=1 Tax=Malaciobacter molluscorum LMG 25693 TaxID=870501 RepID=A0A2G1DHQ2_9BACT|nr:glutamate racemase [Malaciobacter molluscorum]AXX93354.1 glutamate racemase [Malaciobacter molluscorum LMG 25693]PHO18007.1 glutamate racemase [Malaciobacter molluscorum LMG 25693]RXJ95131.1 glutamate racemase [Malaciobacter molluscorum]